MKVSNPIALVDAYLDAIGGHDYERARHYLADAGFRYESPISTFTDADDFIEYLSLSAGIVQRIEPIKVFSDGDDVCHFLLFVVKIAQWARVMSGRIQQLVLVFDAHLYRVMFDEPKT
jgi:hypothetical protein